MFTQAKLILQSYKPLTLEKGMWFLAMHHGQMSVYELGYHIYSEEQIETYVGLNGYPVEPYLYIEGNPNIPGDTFCIAEPEQIGWFDAGDASDELYDITLKEINNILDNGGHCDVEVEYYHTDDDEAIDDYINIEPVLFQDKVTIRYEDPFDDDGRFDDEDNEHSWEDESWQWEEEDDHGDYYDDDWQDERQDITQDPIN